MKQERTFWKLAVLLGSAVCLLSGCTGGELLPLTEAVKADMQAKGYYDRDIKYSFPEEDESAGDLLSEEDYFQSLNPTELSLLSGEPGISEEDYQRMTEEQLLELTKEDQAVLTEALVKLQESLDEQGFEVPPSPEITFAKSTMKERAGADIYSVGNVIVLGQETLDLMASDNEVDQNAALCLLSGELFHVYSQDNPFFRKNMYNILGFTVENEEPEFSEEVKDLFVRDCAGSDYRAHAAFTIDGAPTEGVVVSYTEKAPEEGDTFRDTCKTGVVPYDTPDRIVPAEEIPDFKEVMGENVKGVTSAEDCLAWNFAFCTVLQDAQGETADKFPNPEIIEEMGNYLSTGEKTKSVTGGAAALSEAETEEARQTAEEAAAVETGAKAGTEEKAESTAKTAGMSQEEIDELAMEVIRGSWGNNGERMEKLAAAGYDAKAVQKRVNEIMKTL